MSLKKRKEKDPNWKEEAKPSSDSHEWMMKLMSTPGMIVKDPSRQAQINIHKGNTDSFVASGLAMMGNITKGKSLSKQLTEHPVTPSDAYSWNLQGAKPRPESYRYDILDLSGRDLSKYNKRKLPWK